jgi:HPt (histidine-containing phosphotransfer) domain-containing protein
VEDYIKNNLQNEDPTLIVPETLKKLEEAIGHDGMTKVVSAYLREMPKAEESMNSYLSQKNISEIHKIGHKNKSASLTVGANGLAKLYSRLEDAEEVESAADLQRQIQKASVAVAAKLSEQVAPLQ